MDKRAILFACVCKAVTQVITATHNSITPESRYLEDLGATSLDLVTFVMLLEDDLGISVVEEEVRALATVGETVEYLHANFAHKLTEAV